MDTLLAAKAASGKSFSEIAAELGLTNAYTARGCRRLLRAVAA